MREIKFRVWDTKYNKLIKNQEDMEQSIKELEYSNNFMEAEEDYYYDRDEWWDYPLIMAMNVELPERFILEQYIGIKDKKGVEIYEGDIVTTYDPIVGVMGRQYKLTVEDIRKVSDYYLFSELTEVIGNIHEEVLE